jgi:hypothetical protein
MVTSILINELHSSYIGGQLWRLKSVLDIQSSRSKLIDFVADDGVYELLCQIFKALDRSWLVADKIILYALNIPNVTLTLTDG